MSLDKLTKIDGGGISTTSDYRVGVITATKFVGPVEGSITATDASFSGNVSIAGTLTYEDVTNVDSVGILTARDDIKLTAAEGKIEATGATGLTLNASHGSAYARIRTAGSERVRISPSGRVGIGTDNTTSATGVTVYRNDTGSGNIVNIEQDGTGDAVLGFAIKGTAAWQFGIDNSDSDKFKVSYDGSGLDSSTAVTVDRSGHVGIGTNTPGAVLHVEKNGTNLVLARFESNMGTNNNRTLSLTSPTSDSSTLPFTFSTGNSIQFKCDTHVVHIDEDGRLGIGTDDPQAQLHIYQGTSGDCELIIEADTDDSNENDNPRIIFKQDGGNAQAAIEQLNNELTISNSVSSNGGIVFKTGTTQPYTNAAERLRITPGGSVLVGGLTDQSFTDSSKLAVQGGDSNIGIIQIHAGGGESAGDLAGITFSHGNDNQTARAKCAIASRATGSYGKGDLCFYVDGVSDNNQVSSADEKVRFSGNGLVGITTSDPLQKLNIYTENGNDTGGILVQNVSYANNQNRPYLSVGTKGWTGASTNWNTAGFQHRIKTDSGGTPRVTIDGANGELFCVRNDAKVGINQATPTEVLHINGNFRCTGQIYQSTPADFWSQNNTFIELNGIGNLTHMGGYETNLTSNGYRDDNGQWVSYNVNSQGGAAQIGLTPTGQIRFRTDASKADGTAHNPTLRATIDSSGRLMIGTTTEGHAAADNLTVADTGNSGITIRSGTSNNGALYFSDGTSGSDEYKGAVRYSHSDNALGFYANGSERLRLSSGGRLELRNTSGNIRMSFENSGGLNFITSNSGEEIKVSSGNGDANGIEFWDYTGVNKRCQIDGHGIKFNSDTAAANALDDYEEGTFTPTSNNSLGDAVGSYTKIGRQVTLHIRVQVDSNTNTNFMVIGGFPFNASMPSGLSNGSTPSGFGYISGSVINGGIQIHTRYDTNSTNFYNFGGSLRRSHFSGRELRFGLVYFTA